MGHNLVYVQWLQTHGQWWPMTDITTQRKNGYAQDLQTWCRS